MRGYRDPNQLVPGSEDPYFAGSALTCRVATPIALTAMSVFDDPSKIIETLLCEIKREKPGLHMVCHACEMGHHIHIQFGPVWG